VLEQGPWIDEVALVPATEVECRPIEWLWPGWFARRKLHLLAGAPGAGKTTLAMEFAACISAGLAFPDGEIATAGNVLIWSNEDDPGDGLKPRLLAAGADMKRVFFVGDVTTSNNQRHFDPASDFPRLRRKAKELGDVALVILDPVVSAVTGDSHKNGEVRRDLQPIVDFAAETRAAVVGISHFNKGMAGRDPLERVIGSIAFGALPRIVMVVARSCSHPGHRVLVRAKSNLGPDEGGFLYSVEEGMGDGLAAPTICWNGSLAGRAEDLLGSGAEEAPTLTEIQRARQWLTDFMNEGPKASVDIKLAAKQAGISESTLKRAKKSLNFEAKKIGPRWGWRLRCESREGGCPTQKDDLDG
jgi:putative DNA primase/helicase